MPKEKVCPNPKCGKTHTKRGPYCSYSCANVRVHTEEDKQIRRKKLLEYHQTPEAVVTRAKSSKHITAYNKGEEIELLNSEEYAVGIPDVTDYSVDYDDTWNRAENW